MSGERPLLAREHSDSSSRDPEEEDALLTGEPTRKSEERRRRYRETAAWVWAVASTIVVIVLAVAFAKEKALKERREEGNCGSDKKPEGKRNLVFMVSDGMGPASLELARAYRQYTEGLLWNNTLTLDKHLVGSSRTRSSSGLITDSAAGATAFSCGFKSYNGAISILPDHTPCGTVLEAAKKAGYMTGLVATTNITDATPAAFGAHAQTRHYEDLIAEHLLGYNPLGRMVDVIIGGGRCRFLPNTTAGSCRTDDKDLISMARKDGWNYIDNMDDFNNLDGAGGVQLPLLALMSNTAIPYEIDRRHNTSAYPSQLEMASLALDALKAATLDKDRGFFIMIEGSRIDHTGHANDPAAQAHEVLMHDKTFRAALDFLENDNTEGVLLSTSDHETGGLAMARQLTTAYPEYLWYPKVLASANYSTYTVGKQWLHYITTEAGRTSTPAEQSSFIRTIMLNIGITDPTDAEIATVIRNGDGSKSGQSPQYIFSTILSKRAEIGWSTHGHSAVDVNIYGSNPAYLTKILGNRENTDVGRFLARYLNVDVSKVTAELKQKGIRTKLESVAGDAHRDWEYAWTGQKVNSSQRGSVHADEFHVI